MYMHCMCTVNLRHLHYMYMYICTTVTSYMTSYMYMHIYVYNMQPLSMATTTVWVGQWVGGLTRTEGGCPTQWSLTQ